MPSLIQVLISLATLRFDIADFQDRIMVSLTSLLVLATFFTQTSQSIPKTSYLKLIDIWFVALIFEDFAIIMSLVYVETLRLGHHISRKPYSLLSIPFLSRRVTRVKDLTGNGAGHVATQNNRPVVRAGEEVIYKAAVLEYEPYNQWIQGGEGGGVGIVKENARIISEFAAQAKAMGVDILVVPEYGVQSLDMHTTAPLEFLSVTQFVPDPEILIAPCGMDSEPQNFEAMRILSCTAATNEMYLVIDLGEASPCRPDTGSLNPFNNTLDTSYTCPPGGYIFYNTQLVFDRTGTVIARYRKKNLFLEPQFHPGTESDDTALFLTDFGVLFSLQVCFDIAWQHPGLSNVLTKGVKDVAMSTAWVDNLPFLIAPSVQNGWSRALEVNLLVAGHHRPERSKLGSGIYLGQSDLTYNIVYDSESGNQLIVSDVRSVAAATVVVGGGEVVGLKKQGQHVPQQREGQHVPQQVQKDPIAVHGARTLDRNPHELHRRTRNLPEDTDASHRVARNSQENARKFPHSAQNSDTRSREHLVYHDDLSNYTQTVLLSNTAGEETAQACHDDGLCCTLTYTNTGGLTYSLLAYSGIIVQGFHDYRFYAQVCSVLWCESEDVNSCAVISEGAVPDDAFGPFSLTGTFKTDFLYPAFFDRDLTIATNDLYAITVSGGNQTMSTEVAMGNVMTAGFYGRWYDRDP
ncbi:hypothetical protein Pcinc_030371 [Petrolisthes cinctipes]|uniref:CN hydrolase domain-containing protein n=1 Tax=Petrolisthes cinctipes TaxID=88211 RepID=A0AAE1EYY2_PETCI|nr:hypothetical protein Pcinc_030371 [Petrolisthes cinctipes]